MKSLGVIVYIGIFLPITGFCDNPPWEKIGHFLCTTDSDVVYNTTFVTGVIEPMNSKLYQTVDHLASKSAVTSMPSDCHRKTSIAENNFSNEGDDCAFANVDGQAHLLLKGSIIGAFNDETPEVLSFSEANSPTFEIWANGSPAIRGKIQHMCRRFVNNAYTNEVFAEYIDDNSKKTAWVMFQRLDN